MSSPKVFPFACLFVLTLVCASVFSQSISSSLVGAVTDQNNARLPGVEVQLIDEATRAVRAVVSNSEGLFRFVDLSPGIYTITLKAPGFNSHTIKAIKLSSSETRDVGQIELNVGNTREEVSVTAQATPVQVASGEKSALVDSTQINNVALRGRDLFGFMRLVPGVLDTTNARDVTSPNAIGGITVNGNTSAKNFTVDGITNLDTGSNNTIHYEPNLDAIQEIKILTSNYQAEFGRNSGGTITVITRSGGREFHGSGWWTHRHEQFNANGFFNNRSGLSRNLYRFNIGGYSIGGPAYIPKKFNQDKSKIFFFASQEYTGQLAGGTTIQRTMPTELERQGNFSQSFDQSGRLILIKDPSNSNPCSATNASGCFAGNIIPANRFDPVGQKILNFFPKPNYFPAAGSADFRRLNFQDSSSGSHPRRNDVVRIDVNLSSRLSGYFRWINDKDDLDAIFQNIDFRYAIQKHPNPGHGYAASVSYTFSPTLVNEFTFGKSFNTWDWFEANPAEVDRSLFGAVPKLFKTPISDPSEYNKMYNYLPAVSFGAIPVNTTSFSLGNAEYANFNHIWTFQDNLSKVLSAHNIKTGVYLEYNSKLQPQGSAYLGSYNFGSDANNPLNTGHGYANALLGIFTTYTESTQRNVFDVKYWNLEWYFQDNWRVSRRLTLDYGVRFYHQTPQVDKNLTFAVFDPTKYDKAKAPRIYVPGFDANRRRVAVDPATGAIAPVAAIGLFVPNTGDPANGMRTPGQNGDPLEPYTQRWMAPAPRVGFAYDVFGNGKTALRGGFGIFFNRLDGNQVYNMSGLPPIGYTPTVFYSTISSLAGSTGLVGPSNVNFYGGRASWDQVRNASLGVQQNLGFDTVLEVTWVGNWGVNQAWRVNLNPIPLGATFNPANADPTQPGRALPNNLLRTRFPGYGDINQEQFGGHTTYHGLQVSAQRRFSRGLQFGLAYTWSKSLGTTTFDPLAPDNEQRNYGPTAADRRHNLSVNYVYDLPKLGKRLNNKVIGAVTDEWTLSGITSAVSGAPFTPTFTTSPAIDITGSANATARVNVIGDAQKPTTPGTYFNTAAFAAPAVGTLGSAGANMVTGPGYLNWDVTLTKNIRLDEKRVLKFRTEAYNILNHTQFSALNTAAQFNASGAQINNDFGRPTAMRSPRIISFALRFEF